ncbi:MAG: hypothetical protein IKQ90_06695 [Ruminococcus sp.]|nr:hypothetical protein [Ruminococcus sp.]
MEFILVLAVIAVLCIIFHVSMDIIITVTVSAVCLVIGLMTLLFWYFFTRMLFSKRYSAKFTRIDKSGRFGCAFYMIDGQEYRCVFPEEGVMSSRLYRTDRDYKVRLNKRMKKVFDRFAVMTCSVGVLFCTAVSAGAVWLFFNV